MRDAVNAYITANEKLFAAFSCPGRYYVRPAVGCLWRVTDGGDIHILSYAKDEAAKPENAVIVRQEGRPLIYRAGGYVMVIAIDCVKIAFLLDEALELTP